MPEEVIVFASEAQEVEKLGEELSPPVAGAAPRRAGLVPAEAGA
jgi:hypothetical protein